MLTGLQTSLDIAVVALFLWVGWAYLRGPHSLRRAFLGGAPHTPEVGWRAQIWAGSISSDLAVHIWNGPAKGVPDQAVGPFAIFLAVLGLALVFAGIIHGYQLWRTA